jgi:hypothetical protein
LPWFEFVSGKFPWFYLCYLSRVENRVCLSRGVQVTGATWQVVTRIMAGSDKDHGRSRRPGVEDRGWSSTGRVLGGRTV